MAKNKKCVSCIAEIVCNADEDGERCKSFFAEFAEALKPSHNSDYTKCASQIIGAVANRLGYDLAHCSQSAIDDMRLFILELLDAHCG